MPGTPTTRDDRATHEPKAQAAPPAHTTPAATPDGRTRYTNGERRRAEIIDAATQVFAEQGFQGLSLRQIADAVGVSHTLLRHHFGTKDAILQAVLTRREELEAGWRTELFAQHGFLDALPQVMAHNATIRGLIQLDVVMRAEAINPSHPAHDYVVSLTHRFRSAIRADLAADQAAGRIRADLDLDLTALTLASLIEGVQAEWLLDPSVDMAAVTADVVSHLRA
ncbi:TetR/AcrR family transcriptional regulator [Actinomyces faecalis]|uniref:TetR/AcrR family transcriptional regulator n=1 Tax=Actinomyces faecalis TaxID=2722820 RepID=UPI0015559DFB|nr:TetR/AcrR family transcriptional regulator [Actinomyces faecalis]